MTYLIDFTTYDKARLLPLPLDPNKPKPGYELRVGAVTSQVVHTTNNDKPTSFASEVDYLWRSARASAHFLVGKSGQIVQFLDVRKHAAWHAGVALAAWSNQRSIGIEMHVSVGEQPTAAQKDALAWLSGRLMADHGFPTSAIETHRKIALPKGRKSDPEGWADEDFYRWRNQLVATTADPWAAWGQAYGLPQIQRGWGIPQCWLRNTWLGAARSFEMFGPDTIRSIQWFEHGFIVYQKNTNKATAYMN